MIHKNKQPKLVFCLFFNLNTKLDSLHILFILCINTQNKEQQIRKAQQKKGIKECSGYKEYFCYYLPQKFYESFDLSISFNFLLLRFYTFIVFK